MTTEKQAVKTIADAIMKAVQQTVSQNNKTYVDNQLKNYKPSSDSGSSGGGSISGTIPASHVTGLGTAVAGYIVDAATGEPSAVRILNALQTIANGQVSSALSTATFTYGQISNFKTGIAAIIELITDFDTQDIDVQKIQAAIADIDQANIQNANIDYAQIKDLDADEAIIRKGLGGKFYIDDLAVTEANIVSLAVGELLLKDENGSMVRIVVDSGGNITGEPVTFDGDDVFNNNSLSASRIVENSITCRELNVSSIFADSAMIRQITASNIDVSTLFADSAFLTDIYTHTIQSPSAGTDIDISGNSSITLLDNKMSLIVEDGSTSSSIILTNGMISAVSDIIDIKADTIDLSANTSIDARVRTVVDEYIYYRMDMLSTNEVLSDRITSSTLSVKAYKGSTDITSSTNASAFSWKRISSDSSGDTAWNNRHAGMKSVTITSSDVLYSAVFQCELTINGNVVASVSKSITDMNDGRMLYASLSSNLPLTQIKDVTSNTYSPDWTGTNVVITPTVILNDSIIENTDSHLTIAWKRKNSNGIESDLVTGETVTGKTLVISRNVLGNETSGLLAYVAHVSYTNQDNTVITTIAETTFSLVKNGSSGEKGDKGDKGDPGDQGENAVVLVVYAPEGTTFINTSGTLPISAIGYDGSTEINDSVSYQWQKYTSGSWVNITGATSSTYNVSGNTVSGVASFKCIMTYNRKAYSDVISLVDKTDNYQATIESTGGNIFKNTVGSTTLTCRIFQAGKEVDSTGVRYTCWWYKIDKDGQSEDWHSGDLRKNGKSVTVTSDDVSEKTTFVCEVIDQTVAQADQLKTVGQFTIVDLSDPVQSGTAPSEPVVDMLWIDTSVSPNELKRWNGTEWVSISSIDPVALEERITIIETDISEQGGQITLLATKEELTEVDDKVTATQDEVAAINVRYDDIVLAVTKKSTNYRQSNQPENPNAGDIWVKPVLIDNYDGTVEKTYQALGSVGISAPVFAYDDDGNLLYTYLDDAFSTPDIRVNEDNGSVQINTDEGTYYIINNEFTGVVEWKEIKSDALAAIEIRVDGIDSIVSDPTGKLSIVEQKANRIDWVISSDSEDVSSMSLTDEMLAATSDAIDLSANETIHIYSADQIDIDAVNDLNLSANNTITAMAGNITIAIESAAEANQTTDNVKQWFTFKDEGLEIRKEGSHWYTSTKDDGFYIQHDTVGIVGAFRKERLETRGLKLGDLAVMPTGYNGTGGWAWVDE